MTDNTQPWYKNQSEYFTGALFGLITLDLFMLLIHCMLEQSFSGYNLGTLAVTLPVALVWYSQHLYAQHEASSAH
jgi:hypothetical protein